MTYGSFSKRLEAGIAEPDKGTGCGRENLSRPINRRVWTEIRKLNVKEVSGGTRILGEPESQP